MAELQAASISFLRFDPGLLGKFRARFTKIAISLAVFGLTALLAFVQLKTGAQQFLTPVYATLVAVAAWYVGGKEAFILALAACLLNFGVIFVTDDVGRVGPMVLRAIVIIFVALVVSRIRHLQLNIESLAESRAVALAAERTVREELEREMLEISEREQRRIGQDLHDGLCQLLTGAAISNATLARQLSASQCPSSLEETTRKTGLLISDAIVFARKIAKGLDAVELGETGLMQALEEYTSTTADLFGVDCHFVCASPVLIDTPMVATHLFRIAQEGIGNALKHGQARNIEVTLEECEAGLRLSIADDGAGISNDWKTHVGMGLRTMSVRAKLSGGDLSIGQSKWGGVEVTCIIPETANA